MGDDLAAANATRAYSLAATSIAIFTFMLFFLYTRGSRTARSTPCCFKPRWS